jgi:hypothetical protein
MSSVLTIHKEIEKKEYEKSPLGQLEKKLRKFYDSLVIKKKKLPENLAKEVYDLRTAHEKKYMDYLDERVKKDKEAIDVMLSEAFTKELEILKKYND